MAMQTADLRNFKYLHTILNQIDTTSTNQLVTLATYTYSSDWAGCKRNRDFRRARKNRPVLA